MNNYGNAIRVRRESWDEKQEQLAQAIGVSNALISMIEKGKRTLTLDIALKIADHYRISVEELLHSEYQPISTSHAAPLTKADAENLQSIVYPIVISESARKDKQFMKAYWLHKDLYAETTKAQTQAAQQSRLAQCLNLYMDSLIESDTVESAANLLALIIAGGVAFSDTDLKKIQRKLNRMNVLSFAAIKNFYLRNPSNTFDREKERLAYINDMWDVITSCLFVLKNSEHWKDLGDYYIAQCFFWGLIKGPRNPDEYQTIGCELLEMYKNLGNEYAERLLSYNLAPLE